MRRSNSNVGSQLGWQTKVASAPTKVRFADVDKEKHSPVEELPETSFDPSDGNGARQQAAFLLSPYGATSQVTLSLDEMGSPREDTTVRLVDGKHHPHEPSVSKGYNSERSRRYSSSSEDSRRSSFESGTRLKHVSVNDVVSAYSEERKGGLCAQGGGNSDVEGSEGRSPSVSPSNPAEKVQPDHPELSWTMTFVLLITVTVVSVALTAVSVGVVR